MSFSVSILEDKRKQDKRIFTNKNGSLFIKLLSDTYGDKIKSKSDVHEELAQGKYIVIDNENVASIDGVPGQPLIANYIDEIFIDYDDKLLDEILNMGNRF
ncbi:hypothetical protein JCM19047_2480 [Bacillus sp. JCM 19047]|nr:hypothetical protein JCM19047_2480 [Bacillus sp. JCM 19047]